MPQHSTSAQAFEKALAAENAGETRRAEQWLNLAVKREAEEQGLSAPATGGTAR